MITFTCECGKRHQVKDELAGKRGKCSCGKTLIIPQPAVAAQTTTQPATAKPNPAPPSLEEQSRPRPRSTRWPLPAGIAAAFLIIVAVGIWMLTGGQEHQASKNLPTQVAVQEREGSQAEDAISRASTTETNATDTIEGPDASPSAPQFTISENPDNVEFDVQILDTASNEFVDEHFKDGWYSDSPTLTGFDKLRDTVAIIVRLNVEGGQDLNLAPDGVGPYLIGVEKIPAPYAERGTKERYPSVGMNFSELNVLVGTHHNTGEMFSALVATARDGIAKFVWFVPKETKTFEIVFPPHKPIEVLINTIVSQEFAETVPDCSVENLSMLAKHRF